jgi:transcriptional regulator with XRE-family HTH domain
LHSRAAHVNYYDNNLLIATAKVTPAAIEQDVPMLKIGTSIRAFRLQKGLSQGDIEKKTLSKIARALDLPITQFFADDSPGRQPNLQKLTDEELRFLTQIRRYSTNLNESDRKLLLAMVKKFAATATR